MSSIAGGTAYTGGGGVTVSISPTYGYYSAVRGRNPNSWEEPQGYPYPSCFGGINGDGDYCGFPWPNNVHLHDERDGTVIDSWNNPVNRFGGVGANHPLNYPGGTSADAGLANLRIYDFDQNYGNGFTSPEEILFHRFTGGNNQNSSSGQGKGNSTAFTVKSINYSQGQTGVAEFINYCLGLGDCMGAPTHIIYAGGMSTNSDEGTHTGDHWISEDTNIYSGPCIGSGCVTGSTTLAVCANSIFAKGAACPPPTTWDATTHYVAGSYARSAGLNYIATGSNFGASQAPPRGNWTVAPPGSGFGDQGAGRFVIDISKASGGGLGSIAGIGLNAVGTGMVTGSVGFKGEIPAQFVAPAGTFPVSTAVGILKAAVTAAVGNDTPGSLTITVASIEGGGTGFVANGKSTICVADNGTQEQAVVSEVGQLASGAQTVTATFMKAHFAGALVTQGGTCGWLLSLNADNNVQNGKIFRVAIPLVGSPDSSHAYYYYGNGIYGILGLGHVASLPSASAWRYFTAKASVSYSASSRLVTVTCATCHFANAAVNGGVDLGNITGKKITLSGATTSTGTNDPSYNGSFIATTTGYTTLTYTPSSPPTSSKLSDLTFTYCNCTFTMYPGAEVLSVYNAAAKLVDGTFELAANTVSWAPGDLVEEPHWYMPMVSDNHNTIGGVTPMYASPWGRGYYYDGTVTGQLHGFDVRNSGALSQYLGHGGAYSAPETWLFGAGLWYNDITLVNAPESSVISVGCKAASPAGNDGCTKWDAAYNVMQLATGDRGLSSLVYDPANVNMRYVFDSANSSVYLEMGNNVHGSIGTAYGSPGISLRGAGVSLYTPSLTLNDAKALTSVSGTGSSIASTDSPTIHNPNLTGTCTGSACSGFTGTYDGPITATHYVSAGLAPRIVAGPGAGRNAAVALIGSVTDSSGVISITTGAQPAASGVIATITFGTPWKSGGAVCQLQAANANAPLANASLYVPPASETTWTINSNTTALSAATVYLYTYNCTH
jgi:hypothetical protein